MEKNLINKNGPEDGSILASIDKKARLFKVPVAYFEGLSDEIMACIRIREYSRQLDYQVPKGYFVSFAGEVLQRIKNEAKGSGAKAGFSEPENDIQAELAQVAPLLLKIGNKNVYQVPGGYFENLSPLDSVNEEAEEIKVIPITAKKKFWRTAVAAAAILGVLVSGERYFNHDANNGQPNAPVTQFAATVDTNNDSFQRNLSGLSDFEIAEYLKSQPDLSTKDSMFLEGASETQQAISDMTNEELETYLDRTPATY